MALTTPRSWSVALWPLLALGLAGPVASQAPDQTEQNDAAVAQLPANHAETQRDRLLSAAARTAMNYVGAATRAIEADESGQAQALLTQARRILDQIQVGLPEQQTPGTGAVTAIPVLARVHATNGGEIGAAVAAQVQALEPLVLTGQHERVLAELQGIGVPLTYNYVRMPVRPTSDGVDQATAALAAGDDEAALGALAAIVQGLDIGTMTIAAPEQAAETTPSPSQSPKP